MAFVATAFSASTAEVIAMQTSAKVTQELVALADISREDLAARWERAHGCPPPPAVRRELLVYSAAWQIQAKRLGGFSAVTKRLLNCEVERIKNGAAQASAATTERVLSSSDHSTGPNTAPPLTTTAAQVKSRGNPSRASRRQLTAGARLIREWQGRTFVVDVTDSGYLFEGREHRSLTAIALQITGVQWSGPRFFGL
jgi:hypothetical protein